MGGGGGACSLLHSSAEGMHWVGGGARTEKSLNWVSAAAPASAAAAAAAQSEAAS